MNSQYAIVAFPIFDTAARIEAVRRQFDPLAAVLAAHVTIVFPFGAPGPAAELVNHIAQAAAGTPPFDIALTEVSVDPSGYIMLNLGTGAAPFADLHSRLYTGVLAGHLSHAHVYRPHVTVARVSNLDHLAPTAEVVSREFSQPMLGRVSEVSLLRLDSVDSSSVIAASRLGSSSASTVPNDR